MKKSWGYLEFIKGAWALGALGVLLNLLFGYAKTESAVYLQKITDAIESRNMESLIPFVIIGGGITFLSYLIRWTGAIVPMYLAEKFSYEARMKLFERLCKIPFIKYEIYSTGELQSIIQNDSKKAGFVLYIVFSRILSSVFLFIFSIWAMAWTNLAATAVAVLIVIGASIINQLILKNIKNQEKEAQQSLAEMTKSLESTFSAAETIKTASAEDYAVSLYLKKQEKYCSSRMKVDITKALRTLWYGITENLCLYGSIGYLGFLGVQGTLTIGEVLMFIYLVKQIIMPIEVVLRWMASIPGCRAGMERIDEILKVKIEEEKRDYELKTAKSLSIDKLCFGYPDSGLLIKDFSMVLEKNKVTAIRGQSGSGKTTLLKLISGLYPANSGEFRLDGKKLPAIKGAAYASIEKAIFPMSVYENICLGNRDITKESACKILKDLGFEEWLSSLSNGIDSEIHEDLSGGQRQAIVNARAILSNKALLIFDEPFSALDCHKEELFMNIVKEIKPKSFIIITSHRMLDEGFIDNSIELGASTGV